ncbi:MAG: GNAT family N-acetyltransferase [Ruminococcus sp.]|nr:GNAT family N-acetyltransferase [Ruminococcus sp.]
MNIIPYDTRYKEKFIEYNIDWILDNFGFLEKEDEETFENIEQDIANGAMIYFAIEGESVLAACMTKPMQGGTWEICKLASNKHRPHKGCGSAVFLAAMQWAINHGASRLFIISNRKLKTAIYIYEKYGFKEVQLTNYNYIRGDIAFEKIID